MKNYPFNIVEFIRENVELVKKYLKKNTYDIFVSDVPTNLKDYYKRNPNVINVNAAFELSDLQKLEYIKCMRDVVYFTKKYIKIISIDDGVIPFNLYSYQEELLNLYANNRFVISMQCRQSGKTATTAAFILHYATFNPSKTTAILANKAAQAREILSRIQMSYENLPAFLKQCVSVYNKGSIKFSNYSDIFCAASSSTSIRGRSISLLYIDEAAFLRDDMEFYESTYPTISSGKESRVIITSTPNGARGLFYKLWKESEEEINNYKRMMIPWYMVPGRDDEWKREQIGNTSPEQFNQEHGLVFRGSQNSLLSSDTLARLPFSKPSMVHGDLKIYTPPVEKRKYIVTVDVSRGVGLDYSAFVVFDITTVPYKIVATYKNNRISPLIYPQIIHTVAMKYNEAFVLVEINDIGEQVASIMYYDFEYENMLMCYSDKNKQTIGFNNMSRVGVRTTTPVKAIGCSNVKTLVENDKLELVDEDVIAQFGTFIPKGKSYEADSGANDDLVMCCVIFSWAVTQPYLIDAIDRDIKKSVNESDAAKAMMEDMLPFGFVVISGDDELEPNEMFNDIGFDENDDEIPFSDKMFSELNSSW